MYDTVPPDSARIVPKKETHFFSVHGEEPGTSDPLTGQVYCPKL